MVNSRAWRKAMPLAVAAVAVLAGAVLMTWNPSEHPFPKCVFHSATGLYCPGCGTQRAIHQLSQGHLLAALRFNAFTVFVLPYLLLSFIRWTRTVYGVEQNARWRAPGSWIWTFLIALLLYTALRNIPYPPFTMLAPPAGG